MRFFFRVDASVQLGTGHLMRCLTLAQQLGRQGARVSFVCRQLPENLRPQLEEQGYDLWVLPGEDLSVGPDWQRDAAETAQVITAAGGGDWLIVDHYALDRSWEQALRPRIDNLMVIDDLADRHHDCDLLLDQNFYANLDQRYAGLIPRHCRQLLGPRFALLRDEFFLARRSLRERDGQVRRLLVFFGGSDPTDETAKALKALQLLNRPELVVDVVLGGANPRQQTLQAQCARLDHVRCHVQVANLAELMSAADLSLGAGGSATWERCFLGLPTITVMVADNQLETTLALAQAGAIQCLGTSADVSAQTLAFALKALVGNAYMLKSMSQKSLAVMGGDGFQGASGVRDELLEILRRKRSF